MGTISRGEMWSSGKGRGFILLASKVFLDLGAFVLKKKKSLLLCIQLGLEAFQKLEAPSVVQNLV